MGTYRLTKRLARGVISRTICFSVFLSVQFAQVLAQGEDYQDLIDTGQVVGNAATSAQAILNTCVTGANGRSEELKNQKFQEDCDLLVGSAPSDPNGVVTALDSLAADQISAQNSASVRRNDTNISVVGQRLELLRVTSDMSAYDPGESIASNLLFGGALGGGASADNEYGRLGVFLNGRYATGDENSGKFQDGFDFDVWDLMAGVDYRFTDNFVAGLAMSYAEGDIDYDNRRGNLDTDAWGALTYGTYFLEDGLFFEGLLGYTGLDYSMERRVNYTLQAQTANQTMKSSPDGDLYSASLGVGKSYNQESWSFTPSVRLDYLKNDVDSYTEKSTNLLTTGGAMPLAVGSANFKSFTSNLGIQLSTARNLSSGVIVPQIRVDWVHEFEDDGVGMTAYYLDDINRRKFKVETESLDSDYFDVSIGLSAQFPHGRSGFISYRTLQGYNGLTYNSIQAGFRIELN